MGTMRDEVKSGERWVMDNPRDNAFIAEIVETNKYKIIFKIRGGDWYSVVDQYSLFWGTKSNWSFLKNQNIV